MKSLKLKILLPVLVIVALGMVIVSASSYFISQNIVIGDVEGSTTSKAREIENYVNGKLEKWQAQMELLSATDMVKALDANKFGQYINSRSELFDEYEMLFLADKTGNYKTNTNSEGNVSDRDYFKKAMNGSFTISDPVVSKASGKPIIVIAAPVKDANGNVIGVVAGTMELTALSDMVSSEKFGKTGYAYMVAKDGLVIAHPDKSKIFTENFLKDQNKSLVETVQNMLSGKNSVGYYEFNGGQRIAAYRLVKATGWGIAVSISYDEAMQGISYIKASSLLIGIISVLLIILVVFIVITRTIKPVLEMAALTKEVAKGDLTVQVRVKGKDEISVLARNFNEMIKRMRELIVDMQDTGSTLASASEQMLSSTDDVSRASEQVALAIADLAKGATDQAVSAERGNGRITEVVDGLSQIAREMERSNKLINNAITVLETGNKSVKYQEQKVKENTERTNEVAADILELSVKSQAIGKILEVIRGIAQQTNLLALNAAIEAARAGEAGKGFAVVADEVRKLAEQSNASASQISNIIRDVLLKIEQSVKQIEKVKMGAEEQTEAIKETAKAFSDISDVVIPIAANVKEVTKAAENLSNDAIQTAGVISVVAGIAQTTAAGTEEMAATTEEQTSVLQQIAGSAVQLSMSATKLRERIETFKV